MFVLSTIFIGEGQKKKKNIVGLSVTANQIKLFGLSYSEPVFFFKLSQSEVVSTHSVVLSYGLTVDSILYVPSRNLNS